MFSMIFPIDSNRLEQFAVTKRLYDDSPIYKEYILPTRSYNEVHKFLEDNDLSTGVRLIPYEHTEGFNPAKALNIGVRNAQFDQVIISSPEVKPQGDVLQQFFNLLGKNVIAQVYDTDENNNLTISLVNHAFRGEDPSMYFLAMFNKRDIEAINGWDEAFMAGYGYEDNDFGARWIRAGIPWELHEEIVGIHQYHPRTETIPNGLSINANLFHQNNANGVIKPERGLYENKSA